MRSALLLLLALPACAPGAATTAASGPWGAECRRDRIEARTVCSVRLVADHWRSGRPVVARLVGRSDARVWSVEGFPAPEAARVRVDAHPPLVFDCLSPPVPGCEIDRAGSAALREQLVGGGRRVVVEVVTRHGLFDAEYPVAGFLGALTDARAGEAQAGTVR